MSEAAFDIGVATAWLQGFADRVTEEKDWLTELDAAIGDADHGINMARGMTAVAAELPDQPAGPAAPF